MKRILIALLPVLLPFATAWVKKQEKRILDKGQPLDQEALRDARRMGVQNPERIRILLVDEIKGPDHPLLQWAAQRAGLVIASAAGITYRYGIEIRKDCTGNRRLLAHECVHTGQYERFESVHSFLSHYLRECILIGYPSAPLEMEAIERSNIIQT